MLRLQSLRAETPTNLLKYAFFREGFAILVSEQASAQYSGELCPVKIGTHLAFPTVALTTSSINSTYARAQFDAMFSVTDTFQTVSVPVHVTGVGFFDYLEGQAGQASNGIELHPILDITFDSTFAMSASPQSLTVNQGASGTTVINST